MDAIILKLMCSKVSFCLWVFTVVLHAAVGSRNNRVTIESRGYFSETLTQGLRELNFNLLYKITSSVYIFEYQENGNMEHATELVMNVFQDQIQAVELTRVYNNTIKPVNTRTDGNESNWDMTNLVCSNYYGMGVEKVWGRNITGKGVTIAINDVGIDTDLHDLERNINKELCNDFFTNTSNVSPNHFTEYLDNPTLLSDHGNQVASVAAAVKKNELCSAGIAYDATIVGLKMIMINLTGNSFSHWTKSEVVSGALTYKLHDIDIFVNAWAPSSDFDQLDLATRKAIEDGAHKGRRGLGTIHVVPAGSYANILSNNIHTITVNGVPRPGRRLEVVIDSSVLVSGLSDGNNLTASSMVTTSYGNKCVRTFNGVSAAVSQVSGIIALGLQANPNLKLRDVQHLLVQASEHEQISTRAEFKRNGAFKSFNKYFGFGLLNADKFVNLSQKHTPVPDPVSTNLVRYSKRNSGLYIQIFEFCYNCNMDSSCLTLIEQVTSAISFTTTAYDLTTELVSPTETQSMLMDLKLDHSQNKSAVTREGKFVSVHFWDEEPFGYWQVKVQSESSSSKTIVHSISLTLHGTGHASKRNYLNHCGKDNTSVNSIDDTGSQQVVTPETKAVSPEIKTIMIEFGTATIVTIFVVSVIVCACRWRLYRTPPHLYVDYHNNSGNVNEFRMERENLPVNRNETAL